MDHPPQRSVSSYVELLLRYACVLPDQGLTWAVRSARLVSGWIRSEKVQREDGGSLPVIVSTSPPITTHLCAWWLKRRFGCAWVADFRDPLRDNPCHPPRYHRSNKSFEELFFRNADAIIANTDSVAELWRMRYPQWQNKIHVIWNGFDPEASPEAAPIPLRPYRVMCHVGSLYCSRYPTPVIASLARLIAAGRVDPNALRLYLAGSASEPHSEDVSRTWIEFLPGLLPRNEATQLITEADFLLLIDFTIGPRGLQVPAKLFEYLTIGRPILAVTLPDSPVESILRRSGIPYACLHPGQDEANDQRLLAFLALPSNPVAASSWCREQFDAANQARQLAAILEGVAATYGGNLQ
jgi:glycosyltransferase involved in cell wall biosynthesis